MFVLGFIDHIIKRLPRGDQISITWLYEILAKINDYIPDDWRLGVHSNDFIIRVIGNHEATLVGDSAQSPSEEKIYHIIRTVLPQGGFAQGEQPPKKCPECGHEIQHKIPGYQKVNCPNLYVFDGFPNEDWFFNLSPVAARQYEKINPDQYKSQPNPAECYEYHRIHPLYKYHPIYKGYGGIQKDVFGWVKWYYDGRIEWGRNITPEAGWRGKSFWSTNKQILSKNEERDIMREYTRGISNIRRGIRENEE